MFHVYRFYHFTIILFQMSISEMKTLDYLFIQTVFAIIKWPHCRTTRHGHAFPFLADKWQELIELQWNVYSVGAHVYESLQLHLLRVYIIQCPSSPVIPMSSSSLPSSPSVYAFNVRVRFPLKFSLIRIFLFCAAVKSNFVPQQRIQHQR